MLPGEETDPAVVVGADRGIELPKDDDAEDNETPVPVIARDELSVPEMIVLDDSGAVELELVNSAEEPLLVDKRLDEPTGPVEAEVKDG